MKAGTPPAVWDGERPSAGRPVSSEGQEQACAAGPAGRPSPGLSSRARCLSRSDLRVLERQSPLGPRSPRHSQSTASRAGAEGQVPNPDEVFIRNARTSKSQERERLFFYDSVIFAK